MRATNYIYFKSNKYQWVFTSSVENHTNINKIRKKIHRYKNFDNQLFQVLQT